MKTKEARDFWLTAADRLRDLRLGHARGRGGANGVNEPVTGAADRVITG